MGLQIARERRAHVHGCAQRAGHVTSQGTKPPLRAPDPLHAASHTMPKHVLCVAAANNLVYPITEGPGAKRVNPCTHGRRWTALHPTPVPVHQKTRNVPIKGLP